MCISYNYKKKVVLYALYKILLIYNFNRSVFQGHPFHLVSPSP